MSKITIHLPDAVAAHEGDIRYFVDSMVRKLSTNSHKGWAGKNDVQKMFSGIMAEYEELHTAIREEGQFEAFMEAVDVANMALLCGMAVSKLTREEFDQRKQKET